MLINNRMTRVLLALVSTVLLACQPTPDVKPVKMSSPEHTLQLYQLAVETKDLAALKEIYVGLDDFYFGENEIESAAYTIISRTVYANDLVVEGFPVEDDVPIWAKAGNVELLVEHTIAGRPARFSYVFQQIDGWWYMVSHFSVEDEGGIEGEYPVEYRDTAESADHDVEETRAKAIVGVEDSVETL